MCLPAQLSAGTDNGDGTWTVDQSDLSGLTITPPEHDSNDFVLTTSVTFTEGSTTEDYTGTVNVVVNAVIDELDAEITLTQGQSSITTIETDPVTDGDYQILFYDSGLLPPDAVNSQGFIGGTTTYTVGEFETQVVAISDDDNTFNDSNNVGGAISDVSDNQVLTTGMSALSISAAAGTEVSSVAQTEVHNLTTGEVGYVHTIQVAGDPDYVFASTISISTGDQLEWTNSNDSSVQDPVFNTGQSLYSALLGNDDVPTDVFEEDDTISLDLSSILVDTDGSEAVTSYLVGPLPEDTILSAGVYNGDNTWTLSPNDLAGLTMTLAPHSSDDFLLEVQAISEETDPDTNAVSNTGALQTLMVAINPKAETISLATTDATGQQNTPIDLDISASIPDIDGSEVLSILVSGVPAGVTLSAGTDNGDGSYTLTESELAGLQATATDDVTFTLSVDVTSTDTDIDSGRVSVSTATDTLTVTMDETVAGPWIQLS